MKTIRFLSFALPLLALSSLSHADSFQMATSIEKKENAVSVSSKHYLKLSLIKIQINTTGTIHLHGNVQVSQGIANVVMWSKVKGHYYFSKLPKLQKISSSDPITFSIPFRSPKDIISEVVLEVELPQGGQIKFDQLGVNKR